MSIDWSKVQKEHIGEACRRYDGGENRPTSPARTTFLVYKGDQYPAKFIRGLAYEIATGDKLGFNDYSGGLETVRFFNALGLSVKHSGKIIDGVRKDVSVPKSTDQDPDAIKSSSGKTQKDFLFKLLKQRFGCVVTEAKFDWLKVPDRVSMDGVFDGIYENLSLIHDCNKFTTPGYQLACDYFIPSQNLIIEYDEKQHFTIPRANSLAYYPSGLNLNFDKDKWCKACEDIKATDNDPKYRDEQRAFYDSVRDILAAHNGMTLIRIKDGDYDWKSESGPEILNKLIGYLEHDTYPSDNDDINVDETIEQIARCYTTLQETYRGWAKGFKNHEDVIDWLKNNNLGERPKQKKLNLLCSHWNPITISVLRILAPDCIANMKEHFNKLINLSGDQIYNKQIWYLLYFLHPVRHETYFFDIHYPYGYAQHLCRLLRSHRLGLISAKSYLSKEEDRKITGSHISACGTVAFKHLHIHPTTSEWGEPNLKNLTKESILDLNTEDDDISFEEQKVAIAISARATPSFEKWFEYAPCAMNEGPIFTLKKGKKHSDCFKAIVDILNDPDEAEFGTSPLNDDCDDDELFDGYELEIGTDPLVSDTDYDGFDDKVENNDPDHDPLVYEKRYSTLEIGRELVIGAALGEWGADDHDNVYYLAGWMLSGLHPVGDVRDIAASIWNGDGLGMLLNALALIPLGGDALKVGETISTFSAKHPHMLFTVAGFVTKHVDDSIDTLKYVYDDDFLKRLNSKGFSDDVIVTLSKQNINLKRFDNILENSKIYDDFPGLPVFIKEVVTKEGAILSDRVTFNVKKMVAADAAGKSTAGYLGNLKGAYTEDFLKTDIAGETIKDISHINKGGLDYVALDEYVLKIVEAKARQSLRVKDIKNYVKTDKNGVVTNFNADYAIGELGEDYFKDSGIQKRFVLYLNGPDSQTIKNSLNLPDRLPYKFKSKRGETAGQEIKGTLEVVVMAVNK